MTKGWEDIKRKLKKLLHGFESGRYVLGCDGGKTFAVCGSGGVWEVKKEAGLRAKDQWSNALVTNSEERASEKGRCRTRGGKNGASRGEMEDWVSAQMKESWRKRDTGSDNSEG